MLGRLLLFFMIMPFLELFVIIRVHQSVSQYCGSQNAWFFTLGMIFLAVVGGVSLAKTQGVRLLTQAQEQLRQGTPPSLTALQGLLMLVGSILLIIPGYVTDVFGIFLLIPWTRSLVVKGLKSWLGRQVQRRSIVVQQAGFYNQPSSLIHDAKGGEIIDVEPIQK